MTIAGHTFRMGYCSCGLAWSKVRYADEPSLEDHYGWAHVGKLNQTELDEIRAEVVREDQRIAAAMADLR